MAPDAKSQDLLYVADFSEVTVYSYPQGKLEGALKGFDSAVGECVDKEGNVFVTNQRPARIFEYAHGQRKRIATLKVPVGRGGPGLPVGCSIDPTTGDLAVTGFSTEVKIFKNARGKPSLFNDPNFYFLQYCGYDDKGNLFIAGWRTSKGKPGFAELAKSSKKVTNITLNASIYRDAGVQWDGKHVAVFGYYPNSSTGQPVIYRFAISGDQGTQVGMTTLGSPAYLIFQFFIVGGTIIAPNWYGQTDGSYNVLFYNYPAGGPPVTTLTNSVYSPRGVVLSAAS